MTIDIEPRGATAQRGADAPARPAAPAPSAPITPEPVRMPGRRNPKWIALGIVALCLGGLLSYVIYSRVATETTVVAVANTVYRGELIDRDDLTTITLQGSALAQAVPARELDNLVGKRAAFDLAEGSVVVSSAVTAEAVPAVGRAVVGLKLAMGRVPTSLLVPSSRTTPGRAAAGGRRFGQAHRRRLRRARHRSSAWCRRRHDPAQRRRGRRAGADDRSARGPGSNRRRPRRGEVTTPWRS